MRNLCFFSIGIYNITVVSICHPITLILTIQEYCPRCRIIINTDSQQFADGSNWQIVGFTSGDISMTFFKCEYLSRFNFQLYLAFHTALHMPALLRLKKCERYRMFCPLSQLIVQSHIRPARFLFRNTNVPKNLLQVFSHFLSSTVGKSFQPCSSFSKMESFK